MAAYIHSVFPRRTRNPPHAAVMTSAMSSAASTKQPQMVLFYDPSLQRPPETRYEPQMLHAYCGRTPVPRSKRRAEETMLDVGGATGAEMHAPAPRRPFLSRRTKRGGG